MEEFDNYRNNSIRITSIKEVIKFVDEIIKLDKNILLVLDIDGTVLSTVFGRNFMEDEICQLVKTIYDIYPDNLIFLTSRLENLRQYTIDNLNDTKLLKNEVNYNVICSPTDSNGNSTKGSKILDYLTKNKINDNKWIIFVDDSIENIDSVKEYLSNTKYIYTLFYYKYKP